MTTPTPISQELTDALAGQYALEREIGRGGMGVVYLARDLKLDRLVAIKTLPPHLASDPAIRERFLREARTAGSLSHPNIVPVHRADEIAGQVFFVMHYVDGDSLAARVRARGRLTARETLNHLDAVATALTYAHSRQVIHRDVKAENILVDRETDRALVTDFGIARLAEAAPLTATGQMLGTVYYLSPEQISGEPVDARADLYSLGVVGYLAVTGRFPFEALVASAVLVAHVNKPVPPLATVAPDVPPALAAIIERCLAKDPRDRYATAKDLVYALRGVATTIAKASADSPSATLSTPPVGPLVSDTEAHAILQRAAELDALTAARARPVGLPARRDVAQDLARTSGFSLATVREAALEVGIAEQHVERAMAERGLGTAPPGVETPVPGARGARPRRGHADQAVAGVAHLVAQAPDPSGDPTVDGAKARLRYVAVVEGEMPERDFDLLVRALRQEAGTLGITSTVGRSLMWESDASSARDIRASVVARDGQTTISVFESLDAIVPHSLVASPTAAVTTAAVISIVSLDRNPELIGLTVLLAGLWYASSYVKNRSDQRAFVELSKARGLAIRMLTEELAARAGDAIATVGTATAGDRGESDASASAGGRASRAPVSSSSAHLITKNPGGRLDSPDTPVKATLRGPEPTFSTRVFGRPTFVECEAVLDGEMRTADFDVVVDLVRRRLRDRGALAAHPHSLEWTSLHNAGRRIEVTVFPRYGKTAIRVTESLTRLASNLFGWTGVGVGVAALSVIARAGPQLVVLHGRMFLAPSHYMGRLAVVGTLVALSFGLVRAAFTRLGRARELDCTTLTEEIATQAQRSIAEVTARSDGIRAREYVLNPEDDSPRPTSSAD